MCVMTTSTISMRQNRPISFVFQFSRWKGGKGVILGEGGSGNPPFGGVADQQIVNPSLFTLESEWNLSLLSASTAKSGGDSVPQ